MSHGIVHFELPADDPEKLGKFYTDLFGWTIQKVPMGEMDYYMVQTVKTNEQGIPQEPGINGGMTKRMDPNQALVNYVQVESVDEYLAKAKKLGATEMMGKSPVPQMGWFALLVDPSGNQFGIWQDDPSAV
jgi:predicted enzyme related to lactoylglutathione lyase